jgi:hypothetical protein
MDTVWSRVGSVLAFAAAAGLCLATARADAQGAGAASAAVELLYAEPGAAPNSWLGHVAIVVTEPATRARYVYHYGSFDTRPATIRAALTGHPVARLVRRRWEAEVERLRLAGRRTTAFELRLSGPQAAIVRASLEHARTTLRDGYAYDYLRDNCATRLRDLLDGALDGALRRSATAPARQTPRTFGFALLARRSIAAALAADLVLGPEGDRPVSEWELAAFPAALQAIVARVRVPGPDGESLPLVVRRRLIVDVPVAEARAPRVAPFAIAGVVLGALTLLVAVHARRGRRWARLTLGVESAAASAVLGIVGTVLMVAWSGTAYSFAAHNANLLLASPLAVLLVPASVRFATGATSRPALLARGWSLLAALGAVALACAWAPGAPQDTTRVAALALPLLLGHATASHVVIGRTRHAVAAHRATHARPLLSLPPRILR